MLNLQYIGPRKTGYGLGFNIVTGGERSARSDATEMVSTCALVTLAIFRASTVWGEQLQQGCVCLPKQPRHVKLVKLGKSSS